MEKNKRPGSDLSDYCLDRLFDPEQLYYTPMDDLIKKYKKRDLMIGRMYNLSKKYGHVPKTRTRIINAPQMERANIRILGYENFYYPPPKVQLCTELNEKYRKDDHRDLSQDSSDSDEESKEVKYEEWLEKRKILRSGLNGFNLNLEYLKRKKYLSEIEKRILKRLMFCEIGCQTDPIAEKNPKRLSHNTLNNPKIVYPKLILMESIEHFLEKNKWRLVDLFRDLDKDKDWLVLKSDLIHQILKGRLKANESMIDELIFVLGSTKTNSIDYKSLQSGRISHLLKKRREDSLEFEDEFIAKEINFNRLESKTSKKTSSSERLGSKKSYSLDSSLDDRLTSDTRISSSKSSINYLQLPKIDIRPEVFSGEKNNSTSREITVDSIIDYKKCTKHEKSKSFKFDENKKVYDTKSKMNEIRDKALMELEVCLKKPELTSIVDSRKLKKALGLPREIKLNEIKLKTNH